MQGKKHFFIFKINHNIWKLLQNALVESAKPEFAVVDPKTGLPEDTMNWLGQALSVPFKLPTEAEFTSFDKNHDGRVSKFEWMAACP